MPKKNRASRLPLFLAPRLTAAGLVTCLTIGACTAPEPAPPAETEAEFVGPLIALVVRVAPFIAASVLVPAMGAIINKVVERADKAIPATTNGAAVPDAKPTPVQPIALGPPTPVWPSTPVRSPSSPSQPTGNDVTPPPKTTTPPKSAPAAEEPLPPPPPREVQYGSEELNVLRNGAYQGSQCGLTGNSQFGDGGWYTFYLVCRVGDEVRVLVYATKPTDPNFSKSAAPKTHWVRWYDDKVENPGYALKAAESDGSKFSVVTKEGGVLTVTIKRNRRFNLFHVFSDVTSSSGGNFG